MTGRQDHRQIKQRTSKSSKQCKKQCKKQCGGTKRKIGGDRDRNRCNTEWGSFCAEKCKIQHSTTLSSDPQSQGKLTLYLPSEMVPSISRYRMRGYGAMGRQCGVRNHLKFYRREAWKSSSSAGIASSGNRASNCTTRAISARNPRWNQAAGAGTVSSATSSHSWAHRSIKYRGRSITTAINGHTWTTTGGEQNRCKKGRGYAIANSAGHGNRRG